MEPVKDLVKVREIVGPEMCLMGGYSLSWFDSGAVGKVDELIMSVRPGSYIFGSCAGILDATLSPEIVLEVYRHIEKLGYTP